jgi:hypothetical protein
MKTVGSRRVFLHAAFFAVKNGSVLEMLEKATMNPA